MASRQLTDGEEEQILYIALPNNMMSIMSLAIMVGVGPHLPIGRGGIKVVQVQRWLTATLQQLLRNCFLLFV
jgi:hypothetical protein